MKFKHNWEFNTMEEVNDIFKDGDVKTVSIENTRLKKILKSNNLNSGKKYLILLSKKNKEYKLGYKNFKVIMSYNPSTFYAMVVSELSEKISQNK